VYTIHSGLVDRRRFESVEQGELLEQHRTLAPRLRLVYDRIAERVRHGRLVGGGERGDVVAGEHARMPATAGMHERQAGERVDLGGDEALAPDGQGGVDARLPVTGRRRLGLNQPPVRPGQRRVPEQLTGRGRSTIGQIQIG
jgi:hypothetical protein